MFLFGPTPAPPPPWLVAVAFAAFFGFRLVAYCLAGKALAKAFDGTKTSAFAVALVRVVIGIVGGFLFVHALAFLPLPEKDPFVLHSIVILLLFGLRTIEWWVTITLFFNKAVAEPRRGWFCSVLGALYSHFLDVPSWLILWLVFNGVSWFGAI